MKLWGMLVVAAVLATAAVGHGSDAAAGRGAASAARAPSSAGAGDADRQRARAAYARLALAFEANRGQFAPDVRLAARAGAGTLLLGRRAATLAFAKRGAAPAARLRVSFPGSASAGVVGRGRLRGTVSYLSGSRTVAGAPTFGRAVYPGVWPGIDVAFHGTRRRLEYDVLVAPGADPGRIRLAFAGQRSMRIASNGDLLLTLPGGRVVRELAPVSFQMAGGRRRPVASRYVLTAGGGVRVAVGRHDPSRPLVVDPVLAYATYLGGRGGDTNSSEQVNGVAVDAAGNAFVTGRTASTDFPATAGGAQPANGGGTTDAYVMKIDPSGTSAVYSTYLGGAGEDIGLGIAVDAAGNAVVAGGTASTNFPTTAGAPQRTFGGGGSDAFVTKLDPSGTAIAYSTYLGGPGPAVAIQEKGTAVDVDEAGNAFVAGFAFESFPTTPGAFATTGSTMTGAFVAKLAPAGALLYSTYLQGPGNTSSASAIAVGAAGNAYVTGTASSTGLFPTTPGAFQTSAKGVSDAFVTKLTADGSGLEYSTFLGGAGGDSGDAIALDGGGRAYVVGSAGLQPGDPFPTTPDAVRATASRTTGYLSVLDATGSALVYSTLVGGTTSSDHPRAVAVDGAGTAIVAGEANAADFPTTPGALRPAIVAAGRDGFLSVLRPGTSRFVYSSHTGAKIFAIALDPARHAFVGGLASDTGLATPGALKTIPEGTDAFLQRFDDLPATPPPVPPSARSGAASAITAAGATLAGTVGPRDSATTYVFEYGTSTTFGSISAPAGAGSGGADVPVSVTLTGLRPDTTYVYRLVATSAGGSVFGDVLAFRTTGGTPSAPTAVTAPAISVADTSATVSGQVNPRGQATTFTVEYGTTSSFGAIGAVVALDDSHAAEPVTATLSGLRPDTHYLYRVVATNATGTSAGAAMSFDTGPGGAPIVATGAAGAVTTTAARLAGTVDAHGVRTAFTFAYGTSAANLGAIAAVDDAGSANGAASVTLPIGGLAPGMTYRYRLVATNARGTSIGALRTFTTAAASRRR